MGLGSAILLGGGALASLTLAIWLVLSYRTNAKLQEALALAQIDESHLRDKLEHVAADYARAVEEAKTQAEHDAKRIADGDAKIAELQRELDDAIKNAAEHGVPPANLGGLLSRKAPT